MESFRQTIHAGGPQLHLLLEVLVAMGLGAVIGYDRAASDKPAGLRTHMLVAAAAALVVGLAHIIVRTFGVGMPDRTVRADPSRVFEAISTAISFVGAGTVIRHR